MYIRKIFQHHNVLIASIPKDLARFLEWRKGNFIIWKITERKSAEIFKIDRESRPDLFQEYGKDLDKQNDK